MNGEKDAAAFDASFVARGYIFRNAHPDESSGQAADCSAHAHAAQQSHDRTRGDKRSQPWNGQHSDAGKPSERAANHRAGSGAGCRAFGRLCALFESEVLRAFVVGEREPKCPRSENLRVSFHPLRSPPVSLVEKIPKTTEFAICFCPQSRLLAITRKMAVHNCTLLTVNSFQFPLHDGERDSDFQERHNDELENNRGSYDALCRTADERLFGRGKATENTCD